MDVKERQNPVIKHIGRSNSMLSLKQFGKNTQVLVTMKVYNQIRPSSMMFQV